MKNIILIFILLMVSLSQISGQVVQINDIKNSTLLIKLSTNEHLINHHINNGNLKKAELIRNQQNQKNQQIISAFEQAWSSCRVYFFYSNHSNKIKNKQFDNLFKEIRSKSGFVV